MVTIQANNIYNKNYYKIDNTNKVKKFSNIESSDFIKTKEIESDIEEELKQKYDIKNATYEEMCEISQKLLHNGKISLLQHMQMTMDHSRLPNVSKGSYVDDIFNDGTKKNWTSIFQERANLQLYGGNMDGYNSYINIKNILEKTFQKKQIKK